jgi:hypothetical protein
MIALAGEMGSADIETVAKWVWTRSSGSPRLGVKDNMKGDLPEIKWEAVDGTYLTRVRKQ